MSENCPYHIDHENRIGVMEDQIGGLFNRLDNIKTVAIITLVSVLISLLLSVVNYFIG